jgi:cell division protein FtsB
MNAFHVAAFGVPGGIELAIVLLVALLLVVVPFVVIVVGVWYFVTGNSKESADDVRVSELADQVEDLRAEVEALERRLDDEK